MFGSKKFLGPKKCLHPKKFLGTEKFLGPKFFWSWMCFFDFSKLKFQVWLNSVEFYCMKKNDYTLLEFRRTWSFLTGAGVLDHALDVFVRVRLA